jgi:hypothetical protein
LDVYFFVFSCPAVYFWTVFPVEKKTQNFPKVRVYYKKGVLIVVPLKFFKEVRPSTLSYAKG